MSNVGKLYFERGLKYFELEQYDQAVSDWISSYDLGYEQEKILELIYSCFIFPNKQEFEKNFESNNVNFTLLTCDECTLDFIPVSEDKYYIFDREELKFEGSILLEHAPVQGPNIEFSSILYTNTWDIREILQDMKKCVRRTVYIVLNEWESKFISFFKLPQFTENYLWNAVIFTDDALMCTFFERFEEYYLPRQIITENAEKYLNEISRIHKKRIIQQDTTRKDIFLSICIPSYNNGTIAKKYADYLSKSLYDSEIEFIISNNGSDKELESYRQIKELQDVRFQYYEFETHQEKAKNILKTLELAKGSFAILVDENYFLDIDQIGNLLNILNAYSDCGVFYPMPSAKSNIIYRAGVSALDQTSNLNVMTGIVYNMEICRQIQGLEIIKNLRNNAFAEEYVHILLAMLLNKKYDFFSMNLLLWRKEENKPVNKTKEKTILPYLLPESRIEQQNAFMDFCNVYMEFDKKIFIDIFLKRCTKTYALVNLAYELIDNYNQIGSKQDVYCQLYQGQIKYLNHFPFLISEAEQLDIQKQLYTKLNREVMKSDQWLSRLHMNDLKCQIKTTVQNHEDANVIKKLIDQYEIDYPMDLDLYAMKAWYFYMIGDFEKAYTIIKLELRKNPYNFVGNQIARIICKKTKRLAEAVKYDTILTTLHMHFPELPSTEKWSAELIKEITEQYHTFQLQGNEDEAAQCKKDLDYIEKHRGVSFGINDQTYYWEHTLITDMAGKIYEDAFGNQKYNARFDTMTAGDVIGSWKHLFNNWVFTKLECRKIFKTDQFCLGDETEYLLPVLQEKNNKVYKIRTSYGQEVVCRNKEPQHFEYYKLPGGTCLKAEEELCLGEPITLKQDPRKKKLVLNIFVDGISQKVIEEENFAELMPFTYNFFSKGVRCSNAYTVAEWTLPSLATYHTGTSLTNHMIIHNTITNNLPDDITILAEYFKEQGYQTAKIDGDWRSTQSYGYGRGMDRIIYQHQMVGMKVEQVIDNVLDHLKLMKDTNQFIWMCAGDLHTIADGISQSPSTQINIPLEYRAVDDIGQTSVKQRYSKNKRIAYMEEMKYIDEYLAILYRYIEENYNDNEIVVSLFGDHGQGYLIEDGKHFLSEGRSKVGMMFRGGFEKGALCDELISTCDYLPIMCKLAGIKLKEEQIDGRLPEFFGGNHKREYVITHSVHPGDPYRAAIVSKDYIYYFTSGGIVEYDGRFEMGTYQYQLFDKDGMECLNQEMASHFYHILIEHIGGLLIY